MPLIHNTVYTIRNDLTHTVLDFSDLTDGNVLGTPTFSPGACNNVLTRASVARGWGWHGRNSQQVGYEDFTAGTGADAPCLRSGSSSKLARLT